MTRKAPRRLPAGGAGGSSAQGIDRDVEALEVAIGRAREVLAQLRDERQQLTTLRADIRRMLDTEVEGLIVAEVERQVKELGKATERAMEASVKRVQQSFEKLASLFMGRDDPDGPQIEELAILARAAKSPLFADRMRKGKG